MELLINIFAIYGSKIEPIVLPLRVIIGLCKMAVMKPVYDFFKKSREIVQYMECFETAVSDTVSFFAHKKAGLACDIPTEDLLNVQKFGFLLLRGEVDSRTNNFSGF